MAEKLALKAGLYYELTEDIGPIPKGIYLLVDFDAAHESATFVAGKKVVFSIQKNFTDKLRHLPQHQATLRRTPQSQFLDRYYELLDKQKNVPFLPDGPYTMCAIDPVLAREVH